MVFICLILYTKRKKKTLKTSLIVRTIFLFFLFLKIQFTADFNHDFKFVYRVCRCKLEKKIIIVHTITHTLTGTRGRLHYLFLFIHAKNQVRRYEERKMMIILMIYNLVSSCCCFFLSCFYIYLHLL